MLAEQGWEGERGIAVGADAQVRAPPAGRWRRLRTARPDLRRAKDGARHEKRADHCRANRDDDERDQVRGPRWAQAVQRTPHSQTLLGNSANPSLSIHAPLPSLCRGHAAADGGLEARSLQRLCRLDEDAGGAGQAPRGRRSADRMQPRPSESPRVWAWPGPACRGGLESAAARPQQTPAAAAARRRPGRSDPSASGAGLFREPAPAPAVRLCVHARASATAGGMPLTWTAASLVCLRSSPAMNQSGCENGVIYKQGRKAPLAVGSPSRA